MRLKYANVEEYAGSCLIMAYLLFNLLAGEPDPQLPNPEKIQYSDEPGLAMLIHNPPCPEYIVEVYRSGKLLFYEPERFEERKKERKPSMRISQDVREVERDSSCIRCHKNPGETDI